MFSIFSTLWHYCYTDLHRRVKFFHVIFLATRRCFTLNFLNKWILERLACRQLLAIDHAYCCDPEHGHLELIKPGVPTLKTRFGPQVLHLSCYHLRLSNCDDIHDICDDACPVFCDYLTLISPSHRLVFEGPSTLSHFPSQKYVTFDLFTFIMFIIEKKEP